MNYSAIKTYDVADGLGVRVSLFVSGCKNHCKGCFQPETWDFNNGSLFTDNEMAYIIKELDKPYIKGITFLGGDPMELENQVTVLSIIATIKKNLPEKDIWIYTGYHIEDFEEGAKRNIPLVTSKILRSSDVLVDGPFVESLKDLSLEFRGSSNQRLIDLKKTIASHEVITL